ncbi:YiiG family protein [Xanthobacter autotrophicus DSM 431]|uniref:YiiG family protein n=1 Tax=Xanthobacter nonsaccharivorans TaxID=3119912 RepID=UPI0037284A60
MKRARRSRGGARLALVLMVGLAAAPAAAKAPDPEQVATVPGPAATALPVIPVPDLPDAELKVWVAKLNAYVKLLNATLRAEESWNRYLSWVNLKTGPTGKERIIYGLYSVPPSQAKTAIDLVRKVAGEPPSIPAIDAAAQSLASSFEALVPILNEAEAYYDRKDYKSDQMAGGKALHARLQPAAEAFLAARFRLDRLSEQVKDNLDRQELARIERTEGKSDAWHVRRIMMAARKAVDLLPRDARAPGDLKAFDVAVTDYAGVVREFDAYILANPPTASAFSSQPRDLLGKLRDIQEKFEGRRRPDPSFYFMDVNGAVSSYNMMINLSGMVRLR